MTIKVIVLSMLTLCHLHVHSAKINDNKIVLKNKPEFKSFSTHIKKRLTTEKITDLLLTFDCNAQCEKGCTVLHYLVMNNDIKRITQLLKNNNIDIFIKDKEGDIPLFIAMKDGYNDIEDLLLKTNNKQFLTPLHFAAKFYNEKMVKWLLEKYGNHIVNIPDKNGEPAICFPLKWGVSKNFRALYQAPSTVKKTLVMLLKNGSDPLSGDLRAADCIRDLIQPWILNRKEYRDCNNDERVEKFITLVCSKKYRNFSKYWTITAENSGQADFFDGVFEALYNSADVENDIQDSLARLFNEQEYMPKPHFNFRLSEITFQDDEEKCDTQNRFEECIGLKKKLKNQAELHLFLLNRAIETSNLKALKNYMTTGWPYEKKHLEYVMTNLSLDEQKELSFALIKNQVKESSLKDNNGHFYLSSLE